MDPAELRTLMERAGIRTQAELAEVIGVHRVTVVRWMGGKTPISEALALLIREKLKTRLG